MCVIADKSSVLGLGGIIGGTKTSTELILKIFFSSQLIFLSSIRKTAKELTINTDAKHSLKEVLILIRLLRDYKEQQN